MSSRSSAKEPRLADFFAEAGRALSEAQNSLGGELGVPTDLVISNAELEVKATIDANVPGSPTIRTISAEDLRNSGIDAGILSTLRISFVATMGDTMQLEARQPVRQSEELIDEIRKRPDIAKIEEIIGELSFRAAFVPEARRWLVIAADTKGRVVRELVVAEESRG